MYKEDLTLNNLQWLISHKNPTNQPTNQPTKKPVIPLRGPLEKFIG